MKENIIKTGSAIAMLVLGSVIGALVKEFAADRERQMRYLDVETEVRSELINVPKLDRLSRDFKVMLESQVVENISLVEVNIFNFTDLDFENVPAIVEIRSSESNLELIQQEATGAGVADRVRVEHSPPSNKVAKNEPLNFAFTIVTANRGGYGSPVLTARFLFVGPVHPTVQVNSNMKGLQFRDFSWSRVEGPDWLLRVLLVYLAILGVLAVWYVWWWRKRYQPRVFRRQIEDIRTALAAANISDETMRRVSHALSTAAWSITPRWQRWLILPIRPEALIASLPGTVQSPLSSGPAATVAAPSLDNTMR
jgi:hypothetical protein